MVIVYSSCSIEMVPRQSCLVGEWLHPLWELLREMAPLQPRRDDVTLDF